MNWNDPAEESREPSSDFLLSDGPNQWLVSCKHGLAYRIGTAAVNELGAAARLAGAQGGVLLTEGRMERDGRSAAEKQAVEVLDGPRLWPLLQPYLPAEIETRVRASARHEALRRIAIAALGAVTLGLLVGLSLQGLHVQDAPPVAEVADTPRRLRLRLKRRPNRRRPRHHAAGRCACTGHAALSRRAQQPQPGCRHAGAFQADLSAPWPASPVSPAGSG